MTNSKNTKNTARLVGLSVIILLLMGGCASVGGGQVSSQQGGTSAFAPEIKRNVMRTIRSMPNYGASDDACPECWDEAVRAITEYERILMINGL
jgi:uncharacterized protein YceK